ncbi:hypothetical protein RND81_03G214300 [Saponaria officinalis]|uniref:Golgin candidate 4 n=1 Tax=Saponaria officinalis TaxID=3572 RepID=A0AAW1M9M1_SAPOF
MWNSIANLKENLNKIAFDVHDDDDDQLWNHGGDSPNNDRRRSHSLAHSNGVDSPYLHEIEWYKAEIKKLRESEKEVKALSVNYAALLKEKEDHIARLNQEYGSLKQNLEVTNAARSPSRKDVTPTHNANGLRGSGEQSPSRQSKVSKNRPIGNQWQNGIPKQDGHSNGFVHDIQPDPASKYSNSREKELADMLEEKNRMLAAVQNDYESQMKKLKVELEKERKELADTKLKLQDEKSMSGSLKDELNTSKSNRNKVSFEVKILRKEVEDKVTEIQRLQMELCKRSSDGGYDSDSLRRVTSRLEKENGELKVEKEKLESALKDALRAANQNPSSLDENLDASTSSPGKAELEQSLRKFEKDLKETRRERDKALKELARLKQHLLDKELEESEKMDEDGKIIEELKQHVQYQKATISNLERAVQQARASQEEAKMMNDHELQKSKEIIEDLKKKLSSFMSTIDAKNTELMNLQTALGQYYAEIEAKEHLEGDLSLAREECSKLSQLLQDSKQQIEGSDKEKEEMTAKLAQADKMVAEWKSRVNKLEEDNTKLRRALEQSMSRLNRMSVDSDFLVDRRIVIKLLVTYFQRNHSREVLDLMVRMLGFSEEDKQRIGVAQQSTGKGVVRGVLGLPGRLVGGIMGGGSAGTPTSMTPDDQSFADLWVDFLLKETEEREKRESMEANGDTSKGADASKLTAPTATSHPPDRRLASSGRPPIVSSVSTTAPVLDTSRSLYSYQNTRQYDTGSAEFSTVPLTPSGKEF